MSNRIADLRTPIVNLDAAKETFSAIALASKRLAVAKARYERARADLAAHYEEETAPRRTAVEEMTGALSTWISANRDEFADPRTVKTELGEFGLRTVTSLIIGDEGTLIEHLMQAGYSDCFEVIRKLIKPAILKRLKADEPLPSCSINTGDTVVCKVSKTVLEEAIAHL
jgi:phage host-nuclease inhibitor protein Gam